MEKRHYVCLGVTVASAAVIACILSQKQYRDKIAQECHLGKEKMRICCSKNNGKHRCNKKIEENKVDPIGMGEEKEQPYYSETYYVKDQKEDE